MTVGDDPELEELKRQLPPGWYLDADDPSMQQYWDGERWTDARRPLPAKPAAAPRTTTPASTGSSFPRVPKPVIVIAVLVVGWLFFFNTNPGKRITAYVGLRDCYEVTLTGEVVCGEGAERIEQLKESVGSPP